MSKLIVTNNTHTLADKNVIRTFMCFICLKKSVVDDEAICANTVSPC